MWSLHPLKRSRKTGDLPAKFLTRLRTELALPLQCSEVIDHLYRLDDRGSHADRNGNFIVPAPVLKVLGCPVQSIEEAGAASSHPPPRSSKSVTITFSSNTIRFHLITYTEGRYGYVWWWWLSYRWVQTMSLNCGHQQACFSSPRWYTSMANHDATELSGNPTSGVV
jgi:hypothetical protein